MRSNAFSLQKFFLPLITVAPIYLIIPDFVMVGFFILGLLLGSVFMMIDERFIYPYYREDQNHEDQNREDQGQKYRVGENQGDLNQASAVDQQYQTPRLLTRSALFVLLLFPLSFLIVTSTTVPIGWGMILSIWVSLLVEMWQLRNNPELFQAWFLFDVKKTVPPNEISLIPVMCTGAWFLWIILLFM